MVLLTSKKVSLLNEIRLIETCHVLIEFFLSLIVLVLPIFYILRHWHVFQVFSSIFSHYYIIDNSHI